jgi:hypothetical protein
MLFRITRETQVDIADPALSKSELDAPETPEHAGFASP